MKFAGYLITAALIPVMGCNNSEFKADAYGNFEAIEIMVSAEAQGRIVAFQSQEGNRLQKGSPVVVIDTTQLDLKRRQLQSLSASLVSRIRTLESQVRASKVQLENLERERGRIDHLFEDGAATLKQKEDMEGQIKLMEAQIEATGSQKASVYAEMETLKIQVLQVNDQILKCFITSPVEGILLTKYKEEGEIAAPGQPLFKMANMDQLILRAYISGNQLPGLETGERVMVRIDAASGMEEIPGVVEWISPEAEFTPKIIQTKEERISLVYAIKVAVPNDGKLKIGMPGEVVF